MEKGNIVMLKHVFNARIRKRWYWVVICAAFLFNLSTNVALADGIDYHECLNKAKAGYFIDYEQKGGGSKNLAKECIDQDYCRKIDSKNPLDIFSGNFTLHNSELNCANAERMEKCAKLNDKEYDATSPQGREDSDENFCRTRNLCKLNDSYDKLICGDDIAAQNIAKNSNPNNPLDANNKNIKTDDKGAQDQCRSGSIDWGWIICPGVNVLSSVIDKLVNLIADSLKWTILASNGDSVRPIWQNLLNIANIILAAALLWALYLYALNSDNTLRAYDAKKLLSRLVLVAISMNLSFYICAALADLSNIAGVSVYDLIMNQIKEQSTVESLLPSIIGFIALVIIAFFSFGLIISSIIIILALLTVRQVALIILVVLSPLALACYLLPNTEKWFHKWFNWFFNMLLAFPMFTAVWAASRFIEYILLKTGGTNLIITTLTSVAPLLLIAPILSASGGLMGKMSKSIHGITDKTVGNKLQKWDKNRRELAQTRINGASIDLQNKMRSKGFKRTAGMVGWLNGTNAKAKSSYYQKQNEQAIEVAQHTVQQDVLNRETSHINKMVENGDYSKIIDLATGQRNARSTRQAAAISVADQLNLLSDSDMEQVFSSALTGGDQQVIETASNTRYAREMLGDAGRERLISGADEWKNVSSLKDVQQAIKTSVGKNITNMALTNDLQAWQDVSPLRQRQIVNEIAQSGNKKEKTALYVLNNRMVNRGTVLGIVNDNDALRYQSFVKKLN